MSRFVHRNGNITVAYGLDVAPFPGYFVQVFNEDVDEDIPVVDMDTRPFMAMDQVSRGDILDVMKKYGVPETHCRQVALDLPIE